MGQILVSFFMAKMFISSYSLGSYYEARIFIFLGSIILIRLPLGFFATRLYINYANDFVHDLKMNLSSESALIRKTKAAGGDSFEAAIILIILNFFLYFKSELNNIRF